MQTRLQLTGTGEVPEVPVMLSAEDRAKAIERLAQALVDVAVAPSSHGGEQSSEDGQSCEDHVRPAKRATRVA